jgi:hypothetical protein
VKRRVLIALVGTPFAAAAAVTVWLWQPWADSPAGAVDALQSSAAIPALAESTARSLAAELTSGDQKRVREVLAISPNQEMDTAAIAELTGLHVSFDVATFRSTSDTMGTVEANLNGPQSSAWLVTLVKVDGKWKVSTTEPVR